MSDTKENQGLGIVDKATEAVGGIMGTAKAAVGGGSTASFISNARMGDLYEIAAGTIAARRSRSPKIQKMAMMLIDDHTTSSHQLMSALRMHESGGGDLPAELDMHRRTMLDHLHKASDDEFDRLFLDQQKMAHQETVTLFESYAARGENPQLASYARGSLPALIEHRRMVDELRA